MSKVELETIAERDVLKSSEENKKEEYMVAVCCVFTYFGDTLEILTPGIITQSVSGELTLNKTHETIPTVALYVSMLMSSLITNLVSDLVASTTTHFHPIFFQLGSCCKCFVCLCT